MCVCVCVCAKWSWLYVSAYYYIYIAMCPHTTTDTYILQEERNYIADLCKKIAKTGANVILLQKSILRDAITDLGLHFLAKLKVLLTSTTVLAYQYKSTNTDV